MPTLHNKYYRKFNEKPPLNEQLFENGFSLITTHKMFQYLAGEIYIRNNNSYGRKGTAVVDKKGHIYVNISKPLQPNEWAYILAHCLLHLAFGHFDNDKIPYDKNNEFNPALWNKACDIYIARFLADIKFGTPICSDPADDFSIKLNDERKIYNYLLSTSSDESIHTYGTNDTDNDMIGLEHPIIYKNGESNYYTKCFSDALNRSVSNAVHFAGGHVNENKDTPINRAANWFLGHYPLLGSLAASFRIINDIELCHNYEIHIAAVDISNGEIYVNPSANLSEEEWKFVLAHEYLHAGLFHHKRCLGRDFYLWNIACDYVINDWLIEMKIGTIPNEGLLYDEKLKGYSAESIYDLILKEMRKLKKHSTFRGFGHGDIINDGIKGFFKENMTSKGLSLDEFFKNALKEGFDYHISNERGYLPAGLVKEIKALSTPPIPWEIELGKWFDYHFSPLEKHRNYARPSRRQGTTPDIPRPRYIITEEHLENRTFGVVVDTSCSMSSRQIGLALGAIASYATSKDVSFVRVIFCDACAYDAGYMSPDDIAGKVKVTGGGGTILQPAINLLQREKNFPSDAPILIITDGFIEDNLIVKRKHAYLLPKGHKLPFKAKGDVFHFKENN